ncbi:bifunctional UDP-N-acetylglucosamine diphosphorylase/glucosamine-1-phosphate N-acetyltransferase GlmU [Campylobacter sp. CCUG 57310]|uniref:bifunctional UDP-N-acetylglucosamine diphosphorylase/glucosamine-1-phosphate N-acetyltransferase GlmU n=1 Tax=Campylobacter sp. CCUG 57310 TaxID=2517362 RepID=UPI0015661410|nr:bifunctional UDP-N-acetylglucosamine diphosphorylase/glucosamine-1-phosphate N-acetyltransferase GlmU [Campylobacter sp. CCUG 57310]QKF92299.1 fused N-acetylglucosamine-1-phosphate uridyltransferase and glucosamine-1-phosphate acetyltransferase [Campylobacter sp. CCUG 57310]
MSDIGVVILAAGLGTRMKSTKPKVIFEICGEPMIIHILRKAYEISDDVSVVLSYQKEMVEAKIKEIFPKTKIYEQDLKLSPGTAGALKNVNLNSEKTIILCGDMPLIKTNDIIRLNAASADIAVSVFEAKDPQGYGRVIVNNCMVEAIVEQKDASETQRMIKSVNAGCYTFKTEVLKQILPLIKNQNAQNEYYLTDAVKIANELNFKCSAVTVDEQNFMGINDKFQLSVAEKIMQEEIKQNWMKQGVLMRLADSIYIDSRAKFEGECELQENVSIIGACEIKDSVIKSSSVVEDSIIESSSIGPLGRIRPKSVIKNSHIGNFVEVKASNLNKVKAGHLSYLGDAQIDEGTNIGCGTITCNYDGKSKHKTIIGKNVFIGSDTQLIAPVTIGDDVLIAAGSTVTSDVPSGSLAISRSKQVNKSGFFYKFFGEKDAQK